MEGKEISGAGQKMIKSLLIKNFQSHRKTKLEFDPGVNVIYGLSQAGKTAVIRALRLLIQNRPSGAKYYSNFATDKGETEVELKFADGKTVGIIKTVERSKKDRKKKLVSTIYTLNREEYSPGKDIPDRIVEALNISEINIQTQYDRAFLIMSAASEVARTVNRITNLEEVDTWKSDLTKQINATNQEAKLLFDQAKEIETQLAKYKGFEDLQEQVKELVTIDKDYAVRAGRKHTLDSTLIRYEDNQRELDRLQPIADMLSDQIIKVDKVEQDLQDATEEKRLVERVILLEQQITDLKVIKTGLTGLIELQGRVDLISSLRNHLTRYEDLQEELKSLRRSADQMRDQYIADLKRDKRCPVCFAPIDNTVIKRIEAELK